jgi:hypothetical protein
MRGHQSALNYELASRNAETRNPRLVTGGSVYYCPNTHVAAFSRSMMHKAAANNASAVPATRSMNAMFELPP